MWEMPRHQLRAHLMKMRAMRSAEAQRRKKRVHLKRTAAELSVRGEMGEQGRVVQARVVLNDLRPWGIFLFSEESFAVGQRIALTMTSPQTFYVRGRVVNCALLRLHNSVFTKQVYPYRLAIEFDFQSPEESIAVRRYYTDLRDGYLTVSAV